MMNKLIVDGKVAVLISPGFGAGWYTWNYDYPEILFDPAIVKLVMEEKFDELTIYATPVSYTHLTLPTIYSV